MQQTVKCIRDFPPATAFRYDEELWHQQHGNAFVIINCHASDIYYPEHWTPLSLKCAFNGKEYYKLRNMTYAVTDSNFLVMNQGSQYASYILSDSLTESFTLNFTQQNLSFLATVNGSTRLQLLDDPFRTREGTTTFFEKLYPYNPAVARYIRQLKFLAAASSTDNTAILEALYSILDELFRLNSISSAEADTVPARKKATREELYKRLNIVKDYISSCYPEEITLDRLAETCYLNPFYLLREFKKLYRITPHQYLMQTRLEEAKKLLSSTRLPVSRVLEQIGLADPTSFGKSFRKKYGVTPGACRAAMTGG